MPCWLEPMPTPHPHGQCNLVSEKKGGGDGFIDFLFLAQNYAPPSPSDFEADQKYVPVPSPTD